MHLYCAINLRLDVELVDPEVYGLVHAGEVTTAEPTFKVVTDDDVPRSYGEINTCPSGHAAVGIFMLDGSPLCSKPMSYLRPESPSF